MNNTEYLALLAVIIIGLPLAGALIQRQERRREARRERVRARLATIKTQRRK